MNTSIFTIGIVLLMNAPLAAAQSDDPTIPLPEHPRPDFQRPAWVNLNGPWQFEFDPQDAGQTESWFQPGQHSFSRQIVVPFPWESRLSGIGDTEYKGVAWYNRQVTLPAGPEWKDHDCWLVIGACDWETQVWVDGKPAIEHVGGYVPFDVNLSQFAQPGQTVTITVRVKDTTERQQPTGKQVGWYTRTSGIWQTVYLEARGKSYIKAIRSVPDVHRGAVTYHLALDGPDATAVRISSPDDEFPAAQVRLERLAKAVEVTATVPEPELWSPDSPRLYSAAIELLDGEDVADRIETYFGLREVKTAPAPGREYQYVHLNGQPIYLKGLLHQSFHPEGVYQYPDDATVRSDYELCKRTGFNFVRIHIKAPLPRELYWADKLGVMVMQDLPNFWDHSDQARRWYEEMLEAVVERDINHPSIITWINFNETWGLKSPGAYDADRQKWVEEIFHRTRAMDSTRLNMDMSPCNHDHVVTDINSWHFYINDYAGVKKHVQDVVDRTHPGSTWNYIGGRTQGTQPLMNTEHAGISAGLGDQDISWSLKYQINEMRLHDKICGYIYTELSDIEWEHNGIVNYDRSAKEFGYEFWHPEFSVVDINRPDFVVIDAPPMIALGSEEKREVPIRISHWSNRKGENLTLRHRVDWLDGLGHRRNGRWESRKAEWEPFAVVDQPPIVLDAAKAGKGIAGALLVEVLDDGDVVARNYVNVLMDRGPLPRTEALDAETVALRFAPPDFARWTRKNDGNLAQISPDKISGQGTGRIEYEVRIPEGLPIDRLKELTFVAELAAKAADEKLDWPARKKPIDYPQTDVTKWPSSLSVFLNDEKVALVTLADDPADARGALSHHRGHQGSYGYLVRQAVSGTTLDKIRAGLGQDRTLRIRLEVPEDAENPGGLAVFSANIGCYPVDPTVLLTFDGNHGLARGYRAEELVAVNTSMKVLIPTVEAGRHTWRYTTDQPGDNWFAPDFDDRSWQTGHGSFGRRGTPNAIIATRWNTPDIWLRTTVQLESPLGVQHGQWRVYHDEDVEVYVNGRKVVELPGHYRDYVDVPMSKAAVEALRPGSNTIAVHCRNSTGGQNVDVGLTVLNAREQ